MNDPRIIKWITATTGKFQLPSQLEILEGGWSDRHAIQIARAGVPTGALSIPVRYFHSPSEMVDHGDVENSVNLILKLLSNPVKLDLQ